MRRSAKSKSEVKTPMVFSAQFLSKERAKKLNLKKSQTKTGGEQNGPSFCDQKTNKQIFKINTESWKEIISFQATTEEKGGVEKSYPSPPQTEAMQENPLCPWSIIHYFRHDNVWHRCCSSWNGPWVNINRDWQVLLILSYQTPATKHLHDPYQRLQKVQKKATILSFISWEAYLVE